MAGDLEVSGRLAGIRVVLELAFPGPEVIIEPDGDVLIVAEGEPYLRGLGDHTDLRAALSRIAREAFAPVKVDVELDLENGREVLVWIVTDGAVKLEARSLPAALRQVSAAIPQRICDYVRQNVPPDVSVGIEAWRVEVGSGTLEGSPVDAPAEEKKTDKGDLTLAQNASAFLASVVVVLIILLVVVVAV